MDLEPLLAAIEARLALARAATPGPWLHVDYMGRLDVV